MRSVIGLSIIPFLAVFAISCGGKSSSLQESLGEIEEMLRNRDCGALYACLSSRRSSEVSEEEFLRLCKEGKGGIKELFSLYEEEGKKRGGRKGKKKKKGKREEDADVVYRAVVTLDDGSVVELVCEKGEWKIDSDIIHFYPQGTPREAITSFIEAFERKRWDVLARLMPSKYTSEDDAKILEEHWGGKKQGAKMKQLLTVLESHLQDAVKIEGNRAVLEFAPQHRVELMKEGGKWVVVNIL